MNAAPAPGLVAEEEIEYMPREEIDRLVETLENEMKKEAQKLNFERAAECRDRIKKLKILQLV
jgi:excinuclease ABC subunit B